MTDINIHEKRDTRFAVTVLTLLVCVGILLRIYHLNSGLWYDEIMTLLGSVRLPLKEIATRFPSNNTHIFYSALARICITIFGEHVWSFRLPAVIFGVAAIPMLYLVGKEVTSRFETLLAASILTVSYHHIWFSQNARGYTALLFFVLLATYLLLSWLRNRSIVKLLAYAVVAALGSYTHLTMVFVIISHAFVCAGFALFQGKTSTISKDWKCLAAAFVMSGVLTIGLYAPVMLKVHDFFTNSIPRKLVATPRWAFWEALSGLKIGLGTLWIVVFCGGVICVGFISYFRENRIVPYLFFLPALVTLLLAIAMGRPIFPRFFFFLAGFVLLVLVRGAAAIGAWVGERSRDLVSGPQLSIAAAGILSLSAIVFSVQSLPYGYRYPKQDYQGAVEYVQQNLKDTEQVAVIGTTAASPIIEFFGQPWRRIDCAEEFLELRTEGTNVWLIYTFPLYIKANQPELWGMIQNECEHICRFDGTIAGGNIDIFRWSLEKATNILPLESQD
ncbi:MAG: glycosyltransferase family 39 protein [Pirellulales bacterium]